MLTGAVLGDGGVFGGGPFGVDGGGAGGGTGGKFDLGVGGNMLRFPGVQGLVIGVMGDISMSDKSGTM